MIFAHVVLADDAEIKAMVEDMRFAIIPSEGEQVEIDGKLFAISSVVALPSISSAGVKLKVTIRPQ